MKTFSPNSRAESETIQEFVRRSKLNPEEIAWQQTQPVNGSPSLARLRAGFEKAGFKDIQLQLSSDREDLAFQVTLTDQVVAENNDALLRLWITVFRGAGFRVGFEELGIVAVDGFVISGMTPTSPIDELAEHGAPQIEC